MASQKGAAERIASALSKEALERFDEVLRRGVEQLDTIASDDPGEVVSAYKNQTKAFMLWVASHQFAGGKSDFGTTPPLLAASIAVELARSFIKARLAAASPKIEITLGAGAREKAVRIEAEMSRFLKFLKEELCDAHASGN